MITRKSTRRKMGLVSVALVASIIMQWLIIPEIKWDAGVNADYSPSSSTTDINYESILGFAIDYGIVSPKLRQGGHMETTFATNSFSRSGSVTAVDYLDSTSTARFAIGSIEDGNYLNLGTTTAGRVIIQAPSAIFNTPVTAEDDSSKVGRTFNSNDLVEGFNSHYIRLDGQYRDSGYPPISVQQEENVTDTVDLLIDSVESRAVIYHNNAVSNPLPADYITPTSNSVTIDITDALFDNAVVYVSVDSDMLGKIFAEDGSLSIYKNPSSVIVFDIDDEAVDDYCGEDGTLTATHFRVYEPNPDKDGGYDIIGSTTKPGDVGRSNIGYDGNVSTAQQDTDLCRKVVWNIRTDNNIELSSMAGIMLITSDQDVTDKEVKFTSGNISGWLVTDRYVDTNGIEFHFIYSGRQTSTSVNEMYFYLEKRFATEYHTKEEYETTYSGDRVDASTIGTLPADSFTFTITEYTNYDYVNKTFSGVVQTYGGGNGDGSVGVTFQTLSFNTNDVNDPHYVAPGDEKVFYFQIVEDNQGASNTIGDYCISNSYGYINIAMKVVKSAEGVCSFYFQTESYTGSQGNTFLYDATPSNVGLNDNGNWSSIMLGSTWKLGGFYNKVEENILTIKKTIVVPDGVDLSRLSNITFSIDPAINGVSSVVLDPDNPADGWVVFGNEFTYQFTGVPDGTYTVSETIGDTTDTIVIDPDSSDTSPETVVVSGINAGVAAFSNTYYDSSVAALRILKTVTGADPNNTTFTFHLYYEGYASWDPNTLRRYYIYNNNGTWDYKEHQEGWGDPPAITLSANEPITITGDFIKPDVEYTIVEDSFPDQIGGESYVSTLINGSESTTATIEITSTNLQRSFDVVNNYGTATPTGTLTVNKVIKLDGTVTQRTSGSYYVVLTSDNGAVYYNANGTVAANAAAAVQTITGSGSVTYTGLDLSKTYVVTETDASGNAISETTTPQSITGYTWTSDGSGLVATVAPTAFDATTHAATTSVTNAYTTTTPTPTGGETTPTPTGGETTPTPTGGETTPTPTGGETTPTPTGGETTPTPTGGETTPTPTGGETTPTPTDGETTPTPTDGETTPTPTDGETTPTPTDGETTPTPTGGETTPTPTDGETTPTPTDGVTTPTPTDGTEPTPTDDVTTPTPTDETEPSTTPGPDDGGSGPVYGSIIISKSLIGAPLNELDNIVFVLTDTSCGATREVPALNMENVSSGLWGDAGNGSYYFIVTGLTPAVTYTVAETIDGHTTVYALVAESSTTTGSATVVANSSVDVSMVNVYTSTLEPTVTPEPSETVPSETVPTDDTTAPTDDNDRVDNANRSRNTVDSTDRSVSATGETSVNIVAAVIMLFALVLVFTARKLREEAKKND